MKMNKKEYLHLQFEHMANVKANYNIGGKLVPLFDNYGVFNPNNYYGLDLLREYCLKVYEGEIKNKYLNCWTYDDEWYAVIYALWDKPIFMNWYKSRNYTALITCRDHPCTIDEYVEVLNELIDSEEENE